MLLTVHFILWDNERNTGAHIVFLPGNHFLIGAGFLAHLINILFKVGLDFLKGFQKSIFVLVHMILHIYLLGIFGHIFLSLLKKIVVSFGISCYFKFGWKAGCISGDIQALSCFQVDQVLFSGI